MFNLESRATENKPLETLQFFTREPENLPTIINAAASKKVNGAS